MWRWNPDKQFKHILSKYLCEREIGFVCVFWVYLVRKMKSFPLSFLLLTWPFMLVEHIQVMTNHFFALNFRAALGGSLSGTICTWGNRQKIQLNCPNASTCWSEQTIVCLFLIRLPPCLCMEENSTVNQVTFTHRFSKMYML